VVNRKAPTGQPIAPAETVVAQQDGSRIEVETGALLSVLASGGGSVALMQDANRFDGGVAVLSGAAAGSAWKSNPVMAEFPGLPRTEYALQSRVHLSGSTVTLGGAGIEADIVHVRADQLVTPAGTTLVARLPYDDKVGTLDSLPGLTLELTPTAFTLPAPFGQVPGQEVRIDVGSLAFGNRSVGPDAGYLTVLPKLGAHGSTAVILVGPSVNAAQGSYRFFFEGAGIQSEIPVFYNGLLPVTPQVSGSISAAASVSESARQERFQETVRTENVALRLRAGVIAEVGSGRPATTASIDTEGPAAQRAGGLAPPALCTPTDKLRAGGQASPPVCTSTDNLLGCCPDASRTR